MGEIVVKLLLVLFGLVAGLVAGVFTGIRIIAKEMTFRLIWFGLVDLDNIEDSANVFDMLKQTPTNENRTEKLNIDIKDAREWLK